MSEANGLVADHLEFVLDVEEEFGPSQLPCQIIKDRENPLESMHPFEFR
jgi:hypothetical protein